MKPVAQLVDETQILAVLEQELGSSPRLLPPDPIAAVMNARKNEISQWVWEAIGGPWIPSREQVVSTSKARHAVRPVALWDLTSRLAYGALTDGLSNAIPLPARSSKAWQEFIALPLTQDFEYIVSADIASCYQLIDHAELERELLTQTGNSPIISSLLALLLEVSGRTYGIPQESAASDVLAEAYLARLERAVVRKGVVCTRYNDDFRILCPDWSSVVRSIELLSEEARVMGLYLNDSKVFTYKRATYERHQSRAESLQKRIADEAEIDLTGLYEGYGGEVEVVAPDTREVEMLSAVRLLQRWKRVAGRGQVAETRRQEHQALVKLLPVALKALGSVAPDAPEATDIALQILRFEQRLTPQVCHFLGTRVDHAPLLDSLDKFLRRRPYLTRWQTWWLSSVVAKIPAYTVGTGASVRKKWLREVYSRSVDHQGFRAHSAFSMAQANLIDQAELLSAYDRSSAIARPVLVAAIAMLGASEPVKRAVVRDSKFHEWIYDGVKTGV